MNITKIILVTSAFTLAGFSVNADTGRSNVSTTVRLQGYVPVLCRVQLAQSVGTADAEGVVSLGTAQEFCNAPRGYRVLVQHAPDLEGAAVISQGVRIPLSPSGETILTDVTHPDLRSVSLAVDLGDKPEKFRSIGMRIEAKG